MNNTQKEQLQKIIQLADEMIADDWGDYSPSARRQAAEIYKLAVIISEGADESLARNIINQIAAISRLEHPNCSMCRFRTSRGCEQNVMFPCYSFEMKGADQ